MVYRICGGLFLICYGASVLGVHVPGNITAVLAFIAGIALLAGF